MCYKYFNVYLGAIGTVTKMLRLGKKSGKNADKPTIVCFSDIEYMLKAAGTLPKH